MGGDQKETAGLIVNDNFFRGANITKLTYEFKSV